MKGLFIHDHRFPKNESVYYHSYGFDNEFFNRYMEIFNEFGILAREINLPAKQTGTTLTVDENVEFLTISSYKKLKSKYINKKIVEKINESDYLVIRLPSILGIHAIRIAVKLNKPFIIELVGCPWDAYWNSQISKKIFAPIITLLTRKSIKNARYVVYVTDEFLQNRYPTHGKSISCSNVTIPTVEDSSLQKRLKKIRDFKKYQKIVIGTCATIDAIYKGQQYVIKAISELKRRGYKVEYQLVGGGDSSYLKDIAVKYGVEKEVKFLGKLKHEDVFNWLDEIDIYVQPSLTEGLPRSVIEAMSRGCPVFGSNAGGIPELVDKDFIFKKGSTSEICQTFMKFSVETMTNQANVNHENSKKYLKALLYKRRVDFFREFMKDCGNE